MGQVKVGVCLKVSVHLEEALGAKKKKKQDGYRVTKLITVLAGRSAARAAILWCFSRGEQQTQKLTQIKEFQWFLFLEHKLPKIM